MGIQTDRRTTDRMLSEKLTWAFNSYELKPFHYSCHTRQTDSNLPIYDVTALFSPNADIVILYLKKENGVNTNIPLEPCLLIQVWLNLSTPNLLQICSMFDLKKRKVCKSQTWELRIKQDWWKDRQRCWNTFKKQLRKMQLVNKLNLLGCTCI